VTVPTVALIGAGGHGLKHRERIAALQEQDGVRLAALCDVSPIVDEPGAPLPADAKLFDDHRLMLREAQPDVVVICTPPHTHLEIACDAARAGADLLLEKPPVLNRAEHTELTRVLRETGRACQVGFQALGSAALAELTQAIGGGRLGSVTAISAVGSWQRDDAYYGRSPWAGRRSLGGRPVVDGALENPFAHALMQCLALAATVGADQPSVVEFEGYRTRPIEVDDTACLRVSFSKLARETSHDFSKLARETSHDLSKLARETSHDLSKPAREPAHSRTGGLVMVVAVSLCGEDFIPGEVIVHGSEGRAVLEYPTDRLQLPGDDDLREVPGRVGLLENLLEHRAGIAPLLVPVERTAGFTDLLATVVAAPPAHLLTPPDIVVNGVGPERQTTIVGINAALRRAAEELRLFRELGVGWSVEPFRTDLHRGGVLADLAVRSPR
jgi:predicted dehydrogenase